jgi:hypothetical protein
MGDREHGIVIDPVRAGAVGCNISGINPTLP